MSFSSQNYNPEVFSVEDFSESATQEPYWHEIGSEKQSFRHLFESKKPLAIKGPTGCGKSEFVRRMAWELAQEANEIEYLKKFELDHESGLYKIVTKPKKESLSFLMYTVEGNL
jgi:energy-coupling factor transporter ATP-binding protein EcfA2